MSFKYVDTRPRCSSQPVGFNRYKASQCYKTCVPPPQNGTHVSLHFNLTSRFQRLDTCKDPRAYSPTFKILFKQRPRQQIFTSQAPTKCYPVHKVTHKLSSYDPTRHPPGSTSFPNALYFPQVVCNKPLYSKEEVQNIVNRLYQKKDSEGRCPPLVSLDKTRKSFPAEMVDRLIDVYGSTNRLCMKPAYRNRTRDQMFAQRTVQDAQQPHSEEDVDDVVSRLSRYDTNKWPPNSRGYQTTDPGSPEPLLYPPKDSSMSEKEVGEVVDRLYNGRWKSSDYVVDSDYQEIDYVDDANKEEFEYEEEEEQDQHVVRVDTGGEDNGYQSEEQASEKGEQVQEEV